MSKKTDKNINNTKNKTEKKKLTLGGLILRCCILLAVPFAYPFICGLIFDLWFKLYDAVPFIFYSLITLYVVNFVLIIWLIVKFILQKKRP